MEGLIDKLTSLFKSKVPKKEEELVQSFRNMLLDHLEYIQQNPSEITKNKSDFEKSYIISVAQAIFEQPDLDSVKRELIYDESLEQIEIISKRNLFNTACKKLRNEAIEVDIDVDEEIKKLEELLTQVKPFNQVQARMLISEACLDAEYIKDPNTQAFSFRLNREMQRLKREEDGKQIIKEER